MKMTTYLELMEKRQRMQEMAVRRGERLLDKEMLRVSAAHLPEVHRTAPVHLRGINKI